MLIYTNDITPRLQYIVNLLLKELSGININFTTDSVAFKQADLPKINYSGHPIGNDEFFLTPYPLLFEKGVELHNTDCFLFKNTTAFFKSIPESNFSFDIFAASFYLISRYEEYYRYSPDKYGRYPAETSTAFKNNFLHQPVVNIWLQYFQQSLQQKFPAIQFQSQVFHFLPTYDIDIAYSYLYKGWYRTAGGFLRDAIKGSWKDITIRTKVLLHQQEDPYNSYNYLDELHTKYALQPVYFFLIGSHGKYDKNISPRRQVIQQLIQKTAAKYSIGIHPSYRSYLNKNIVSEELNLLASIARQPIQKSRQHYIKMKLPETCQLLCKLGITEDYSMGYATHNGFRAGIASPFYWYDLSREIATTLKIFPFVFMEATSIYSKQQSPEDALKEKLCLWNEIKKVNGTFISIWHNNYLGTDYRFTEWRKMYEQFLEKTDGE
jgi:Family of unknown function (DUF7033)